jgi:hypothetical protein
MTTSRLPRLELIEDPNKKNDFIIFRKKNKGKKVPKGSVGLKKSSSKKTRKHRKGITRKHKKRKSFFNIF